MSHLSSNSSSLHHNYSSKNSPPKQYNNFFDISNDMKDKKPRMSATPQQLHPTSVKTARGTKESTMTHSGTTSHHKKKDSTKSGKQSESQHNHSMMTTSSNNTSICYGNRKEFEKRRFSANANEKSQFKSTTGLK